MKGTIRLVEIPNVRVGDTVVFNNGDGALLPNGLLIGRVASKYTSCCEVHFDHDKATINTKNLKKIVITEEHSIYPTVKYELNTEYWKWAIENINRACEFTTWTTGMGDNCKRYGIPKDAVSSDIRLESKEIIYTEDEVKNLLTKCLWDAAFGNSISTWWSKNRKK